MDGEFETAVVLRSRVRTAGEARGAPLVIALHGWGMTPRAFERWLRPGIDRGGLSWWLPQGILPCEVRSGAGRRVGYAWYVFDGDQERLKASMDEARAHLVNLVDVARRARAPARVGLFGFSQGAYLASYLALSRPDLFDRVVCCAGRPKAEFAADLGLARATRMLVQTGARDQAVTAELIARGVKPLRDAGLHVEERSYDAEHRVTPEMAEDAARFLV